jgi:cystathionine gamma-lyase
MSHVILADVFPISRAIMTHASIVKEERESLGIYDNLIRLSVGVEDTEDLVNDLDQALKIAVSA